MRSVSSEWIVVKDGSGSGVAQYLIKAEVGVDDGFQVTLTEAEAGAVVNELSHLLEIPLSARYKI